MVGLRTRISFGGGMTKDTLVLGVSPEYQHIRNLLVPNGRFFDDEDDQAHIKCAVVSEPFAKERFGSDDAAVGQTFEIERIPFTIIGVFKEAVPDFGNSEIEDHTVLIPYDVARLFAGTDNVKQIYFSMRNMNEVNDASKEIIRIIHSRHRADSIFKAQTLQEYLEVASSIMTALTLPAGRGLLCDLGGGRRGHHEHHACRGAGKGARDRHSQSAGRDATRNQAAVSCRSGDHFALRAALWERWLGSHRLFPSDCLRISRFRLRRGQW